MFGVSIFPKIGKILAATSIAAATRDSMTWGCMEAAKFNPWCGNLCFAHSCGPFSLNGLQLLNGLAGQIAPDCSRRAWLARLLQTCALRDSCLRKQTQRKTAIMVPQETLPHSYGAIGASISNFFEVPC